MEDSHFFLKNIGLESYISHEKTFCDSLSRVNMENLDYDSISGPKVKPEEKASEVVKDVCDKQEVIRDVVEQITGTIQADDFFSSLELQSSSKTSSNVLSLSFSNKLSGGIVTRSRSFSSTLHENSSKMPRKISCKSRGRGRPEREGRKIKRGKCKRGGEKRRKVKTKGKSKKIQGAKKSCSDGRDKVSVLSEAKKQNLNKLEENILEKSLESKEDEDWVLFNNLTSKKEMEDKMFENKQILGNELQNPVRRCTPELFSINSILMSDSMSEGKDEVDKLLEVDDYDDSFLEEMDEFNYAPPRSHTGGKWKPGVLSIRTSPMLWQNQTWDSLLDDRNQEDEGKSRAETPIYSPTESPVSKFPSVVPSSGKWKSFTPPATYTGGKWKPLDILQRPKKSDPETLSPDESDQNWKCEGQGASEPPSTHTGGKWKPNSGICHANEKWKPDRDSPKTKDEVPPSDHGKWVSGSGKTSVERSTFDVLANCQSTSGKCLKTAGGMIQYYCSPCNRRLSSKKMYKKHVQSELHLKRVLQENDLELDVRSLKLFHGLFTREGYRERSLGKRVIKKPEMFKDSEMGMPERKRKVSSSVKMKRKRMAKREIRCEVCKIKVPNHQLGKHLVSYYHSRRIQLNDPHQQKIILDNIHAIVKQAPYQCEMCKFYCNTHNQFKKHWVLDVHRELEQSRNHRFWCALCSFECETSRSMELHLDSNSHREVILAVNKSIPIIIRHKVIFNCNICFKEFRYKRELLRHKQISHGVAEVVEKSNKFVCSVCNFNYKNLKSLQRHILNSHKNDVKVPYFCTSCNEFFGSAAEAKAHRNDFLHKYKKTVAEGNPAKKSLSRDCPYCQQTLPDLLRLKTHLFQSHPQLLPKCIKCGTVFALSQEVSRHVKNNECDFTPKTPQPPSDDAFHCDACAFFTTSKSEYLLHTASVHQRKSKEEKKISCPLCGSLFTQSGLNVHLRTHLKEMTYHCSLCSKAFVRKDRYVAHLKSKHFVQKDLASFGVDNNEKEVEDNEGMKEQKKEDEDAKKEEVDQSKKKKKTEKTTGRRQICGDPKCKYVAKDLKDLEYHSLVHIGPKMYKCPDCSYCAETNTRVKRHYLIHIEERSYPCPHCSFKAKLKSHLNRHLRLHTGAKPYKCPHCSYSCNILENLRKHVLYTNIHPGKKMYQCKMCNFDTNVSKNFKLHLFNSHKNEYRPEEANVAAGIYNREEDFGNVVCPLPVKPKPSSQSLKKVDSTALKKKIDLLTQKLSPIAPKSSLPDDKKSVSPLKNSGNLVEDKRKILEMELQKLRKQIKPKSKKPPRSYPSPALKKKAEEAKRWRKAAEMEEAQGTENAESGVLYLRSSTASGAEEREANGAEVAGQQVELFPAYILYENVLPSEETELYLLE